MNVLFVANSTAMYGANRSMVDMALRLRQKGITPYVLAFGYGDIVRELRKQDIVVYELPFQTNSHKKGTIGVGERLYKLADNFSLIREARRIVADNHIELIHSNASNIDFGAMLARAAHVPHVWHIREMMYEDYGLLYDFPLHTRLLFRRADLVLAISGFVAEKRRLGRKKRRLTLYNGLDLPMYLLDKGKLFAGEEIRILYCGMISENKGTLDAVRAVHVLANRGVTNIRLALVGTGGGAYLGEIRDYIEQNRLSDYIVYYGHQPDMRQYREWADIAVMPSRNEALGRVTIESMLGEVLVIGADCGATHELVRDGVTGYLYRPGDAEDLADKILQVYENKEKSVGIVRAAKQFAMQSFDSDTYADKLAELYQSVLEGNIEMKIAYFMDVTNGLGGAANTLLQQAALMKAYHDVLVALPCDETGAYSRELEARCIRNGLRYELLRFRTSYSLRAMDILGIYSDIPYVDGFIVEHQIEFLHSVQLNPAVEYVSRKRRIPHLMNIYPFMDKAFPYLDIFPRYMSSDSQLYCNAWAEYLDADTRCIRPYTNIRLTEKKEKSRQTVFGVVGSVSAYKNQLEVIKAIELLAEEGADVKLIVAGYASSSYARECMEYVRMHHMEEHVEFSGFVSDITEVLGRIDAFVCGSTWESFPSSMVEAVACGIPVISTPVCGVPEIFTDGDNGYLTQGYGCAEIAEGMRAYLRGVADGGLTAVRENMARTYAEHFSEEAVAGQLDSYYRYIAAHFRETERDNAAFDTLVREAEDLLARFGEGEGSAGEDAMEFVRGRCLYWSLIDRALTCGIYYIWGCGKWGHIVKAAMEVIRPQAELGAFLDTRRTGYCDGIPVIEPEKLEGDDTRAVFIAFAGYKDPETAQMQGKGFVPQKNLFAFI